MDFKIDFSLFLCGIRPVQFNSVNNFEQLSTLHCARNYQGHKESMCSLAIENFVVSQTQQVKYKLICINTVP